MYRHGSFSPRKSTQLRTTLAQEKSVWSGTENHPQKNCNIISAISSHIRHQSITMNTPLYSVYIYEPVLLRCLDRFYFFIFLSHNYHTKFSALKLSHFYHIKFCIKISSSVIRVLSLSILYVTFSHNYHITNIYQTH